jgi:hypothetical protein
VLTLQSIEHFTLQCSNKEEEETILNHPTNTEEALDEANTDVVYNFYNTAELTNQIKPNLDYFYVNSYIINNESVDVELQANYPNVEAFFLVKKKKKKIRYSDNRVSPASTVSVAAQRR